jgi:hypothetical protein
LMVLSTVCGGFLVAACHKPSKRSFYQDRLGTDIGKTQSRDAFSFRFLKEGGDRGAVFSRFWLTNSNPAVCDALPAGDTFEVLDLTPKLLVDL